MKKLFALFVVLLPWPLKRLCLIKIYKYSIAASAKIGLSWFFPSELTMKEGAKVGHFNVAIHLDNITLYENATIGRSNWITGFTTKSRSQHFQHQENRKAELIVGKSSAITKHHHIDCTNQIVIGAFSTVAGYRSQLMTHSIDLKENRQNSKPIMIGDYTFVGTNVIILGGSKLPSNSVLGAKSLLNKAFQEEWTLYGGVPAQPISSIDKSSKYFSRTDGFVY